MRQKEDNDIVQLVTSINYGKSLQYRGYDKKASQSQEEENIYLEFWYNTVNLKAKAKSKLQNTTILCWPNAHSQNTQKQQVQWAT